MCKTNTQRWWHRFSLDTSLNGEILLTHASATCLRPCLTYRKICCWCWCRCCFWKNVNPILTSVSPLPTPSSDYFPHFLSQKSLTWHKNAQGFRRKTISLPFSILNEGLDCLFAIFSFPCSTLFPLIEREEEVVQLGLTFRKWAKKHNKPTLLGACLTMITYKEGPWISNKALLHFLKVFIPEWEIPNMVIF